MRQKEINYRVNGAAPMTHRFRVKDEDVTYEDITREFYGTIPRESDEESENQGIYLDSGTDSMSMENGLWALEARVVLCPNNKPQTVSFDFEDEEFEEESEDDEGEEVG